MSAQCHCWILFALCQCFYFKISTTQKFDENYTRIVFSPYVKTPTKGSTNIPPWSNHTSNEVLVMLEIILEKFSKVATWNAGSKNVSYIRNVTYYNESYVSVYTAEIAADINRRRGEKSITMLQGVWLGYDSFQTDTEMQLAMECVEKANKIYPGTVEGILLSHTEIASKYERAVQTSKRLLTLLKHFSGQNLKFGVVMQCNKIFTDYKGESSPKKQVDILYTILQNSDFVVCAIDDLNRVINIREPDAFNLITSNFLELRTKLQKRNTNLEVMGFLKWTDGIFEKSESMEDRKIFWETVSQWAKGNSFPIWFFEAFDNPWMGKKGWWRLTENSKSAIKEGYIEKISEYESPGINESGSTVLSMSIITGVSVTVVLVAVVVSQFCRGKKLQQISHEDVNEFMDGMSEGTFTQGDNHNVHNIDIPGHTLPYNKSIEIDKNLLKIDARKILGTGNFARVYEAVIEWPGKEMEHVALKVSKKNSSRSSLKELLSEIKVMIYIGNHPNILALVGVYTAELQNGVVYIATELCSLGSLEGYLRQQEKISSINTNYANISKDTVTANASETTSIPEMLKWSYEIACGMEYLGTKNVVHADLATRNVLLTAKKIAKISDFGLSRRMYNYTNYVKSKKGPLPWRWMAIESLKWGEFSAKSDVWAYGVTLWEIFSFGEIPFTCHVWASNFVKQLVEGTRLEKPNHAPPDIIKFAIELSRYALMTDCWLRKPDDRPEFSKVRQRVSDIIAKTSGQL